MRLASLLSVVLAVFLAGCCSTVNPNQSQASACAVAAAPDCRPVYTPPYCLDFSDEVNQSTADFHEAIFDCKPDPVSAPYCAPPPCAPAAPPPCAPAYVPPAAPVYYAPQPPPCAPVASSGASPCGPPPAGVACGETWCCVWVQPPAAAPQTVCVQPEQVQCTPVPAVYETRMETYEAAPARCEWQKVDCAPKAPGETIGECWKMVEVPAVMASRSFQVCVQPASTRQVIIPAVYEQRASAPPSGHWEWQRRDDCVTDLPPAGPVSAPMGEAPPQ